MKFKDLKREVAEMFNSNHGTMSIKYFLPGNTKTLITISDDKDLNCTIKFHADSTTADIYVITKDVVAAHVSNISASRSTWTNILGAGGAVDPLNVVDNVVDDASQAVILDDITHVDPDMDSPTDMPPPSIADGSNKAAKEWQNNLTGVGQRFNSVSEFREALCKYAIAHQFAFKYVKNDTSRVTVKCKEEGCPWIIHARKLSTTQLFHVKKMNALHTCEGNTMTTGHRATKNVVASIIKDKVKAHPNYRPKDIVSDIKEEYGLQLKYYHAWHGEETAKEQLHGSYKAAYRQLPVLCEKIMETNPGSLATFTTKEDASFHRLFVAFHASVYGFQQGCRPLLFLDRIPLKSKYQGTLLAATASDGDDGVFPVAFAIVDAETDENWGWFLVQLKSAFSTAQSITFVADREKGLRNSILDVFRDVDVHHGYCMRYLSEQLIRDLNGQYSSEVKRFMVEDFYAAASAPRPRDYQRCVQNIRSISVDAYNWVMESEPVHWANVFLQGARHNHMTSNFGELFYSWALEAHALPITMMVTTMRCKVMELMYKRRVDSNQWTTRLTPSMEKKLETERLKVYSIQVTIASGNRFEVHGESSEDVDLDEWDCSCKGWQLTSLPCCHAIAVINWLGRDPYDYCSKYFTTGSYRLTYSESVHPVPSIDWPKEKESSNNAVTVTPPPYRRQPGRPPANSVGSQTVVKRKRQSKCSRCKGTGHHKSTCREIKLEC